MVIALVLPVPRRLIDLLFVLGLLLHRLFVGLPDGSLSCLTVVLPLCQDCHVFVLLLVLLFVGRALMIGLDVLSRLRLLGRAVLALVALALFVNVLTKICVVGSQGLVDILGAPLSLVFVFVVCFPGTIGHSDCVPVWSATYSGVAVVGSWCLAMFCCCCASVRSCGRRFVGSCWRRLV